MMVMIMCERERETERERERRYEYGLVVRVAQLDSSTRVGESSSDKVTCRIDTVVAQLIGFSSSLAR